MKFYGELLIFVLLLITNLRVFFVNHVRRDPLVVMAPISFFISILQIISWGIDPFTILGFVISLLVLLSNFHAIFRYIERLYIDHYSPLMKVWASFTIIISSVAIIFILIFAPVEMNSQKIGVMETRTRYKGSLKSGFERANSFSTSDIILYKFEKDQRLEENPTRSKGIILFIPDKRGETNAYKPYLQLLAKEGYSVYSADFYVDDSKWMHSIEDIRFIRRAAMVFKSVTKNQWFMSQREFYTYNTMQELQALKNIFGELYGSDVEYFLVSDVMGNTAIQEFAKNNSSTIKGTFVLDSIPYYQTPGYGCIEQTEPIISTYLGYKRDSKFFTPKLLVTKTISAIEEEKNAI